MWKWIRSLLFKPQPLPQEVEAASAAALVDAVVESIRCHPEEWKLCGGVVHSYLERGSLCVYLDGSLWQCGWSLYGGLLAPSDRVLREAFANHPTVAASRSAALRASKLRLANEIAALKPKES